jgi:hypothetical protein
MFQKKIKILAKTAKKSTLGIDFFAATLST